MLNRIRSPITAVVMTMVALALALAVITIGSAAATPKPELAFTKVGHSTGSEVVYFTIRVQNNSPLVEPDEDTESQTAESLDSGPLLVQDFLPEGNGIYYLLAANVYDGEAGIAPTPLECVTENAVIACNIPNIRGQHLNRAQSAFVNGYAEITIYGVLNRCGVVTNTALLFGGGSTLPRSAKATAQFDCPATPTPTATPTSPPATPTSTPTATSTPQVIVVTATPSPTAIFIPKPPNTGTGTGTTAKSNNGVSAYLIASLGLMTIAAVTGVTAIKRRR